MKTLVINENIQYGMITLKIDYVATDGTITHVGDYDNDDWVIVTDEPEQFIEGILMTFTVEKLGEKLYKIVDILE